MNTALLVALLAGTPTPSPIPTTITSPLNLEVDCALGNDVNPCTATGASACLTVDGALAKVVGKTIRALVKVHVVGSGCTGFQVSGLNIIPQDNGTAVGVHIYGDEVNSTLATGTATGTISSVTAGSTTTGAWAVIADSTQSWTANDLRGRFIEIQTGTSAGSIIPIIGNDATSVTIPASSAIGAASGTYAIRDAATVITVPIQIVGSVPAFNVGTAPASSSTGIAVLGPLGNSRSSYIRIEMLKVNLASPQTFWTDVLVSNPATLVQFARLQLVTTNTTKFSLTGIGQVNITQSVMASTAAVTAIVAGGGAAGTPAPTFSLSTSMIRTPASAGFGLSVGAAGQSVLLTNNDWQVDCLASITGPSWIQWSGINRKSVSFNGNFGIRVRPSSTGTGGVMMHVLTGAYLEVSQCSASNAIWLVGRHSFMVDGILAGTNNLIGIELDRGAQMQYSASSTLTGTTEVTMDSVTTTIAAMRAASPKLAFDNYGSTLFE